jgi:isoleucyl-tRNA synthetase
VEGESHRLQAGDLEVVQVARGDLVVESGDGFTVALDPTIDEGLRLEGIARELVNRVQRLRRDAGLEVSDRIRLWVDADGEVRSAAERHHDYIVGETLTLELRLEMTPDGADAHTRDVDLDGLRARIGLVRAGGP